MRGLSTPLMSRRASRGTSRPSASSSTLSAPAHRAVRRPEAGRGNTHHLRRAALPGHPQAAVAAQGPSVLGSRTRPGRSTSMAWSRSRARRGTSRQLRRSDRRSTLSKKGSERVHCLGDEDPAFCPLATKNKKPKKPQNMDSQKKNGMRVLIAYAGSAFCIERKTASGEDTAPVIPPCQAIAACYDVAQDHRPLRQSRSRGSAWHLHTDSASFGSPASAASDSVVSACRRKPQH